MLLEASCLVAVSLPITVMLGCVMLSIEANLIDRSTIDSLPQGTVENEGIGAGHVHHTYVLSAAGPAASFHNHSAETWKVQCLGTDFMMYVTCRRR